jgi:Xaa-Pro aminopeptidase
MEHCDRIAAVQQRMAEDGIDLLVAASHARHSLVASDPATHLSGFRSLGESVVVLRRDGISVLIASPASDGERALAQSLTTRVVATDDLAAAVAAVLAEFGAEHVAVAGIASLPHRIAERLIAAIGRPTTPFEKIFIAITGRKTAREIERAREAVAIAERGFEHLLEIVRPGMPEWQLAVEVNTYTKSLGADDNFLMLSALPHNKAVMSSSTRRLTAGDVLLAELSPSYDGQYAQICRTVSIGTAPPVLQEKYDLVVRAMWAGIETIRPGIPMSEVCAGVDRVLTAAGYGEYCVPPYMRRRGHGFGTGSIAPGDVAVDNDTILEEGMIFIVHPNQFIPEVGYLLCGEPVRVTTTGVETLSRSTARLHSIAA